MIWMDRLSLFSAMDFIAVSMLCLLWLGIGFFIENPPKKHPSLSFLMVKYRKEWMIQFVHRNPRMFDAQMLGHLRQGTAFFASTTMIAIGGGLALIGNTERLAGVASDLTLVSAPAFVIEVKLVLMVLFVANSFLKFVWAHRLFGYCSVVMSAVPNDPEDAAAIPRAMQASEINITAARSFNRAMRSVYFGLASAAWLFGASALIAASLLTVFVLWRREFASQSRNALFQDPL
ncbi:DUF599 domain-containing protein [Shimia sp. CNT1-13L.2]|jgi:uncharacterized membrane protein|uniref:DUF599 domain-containing protein n=1 Tax=Shimia sp. CNT1-13L.2 TaxID=2959663 RepID=UPI0020CC7F0C|nr:DUF599 domain-containing protein [Shimia sp. CNT1-13L.2]MCP9482379.1 DUF599 domain-containing protein [Shimia sp. CNT1-13L.2]